jgi:hypothetical protein
MARFLGDNALTDGNPQATLTLGTAWPAPANSGRSSSTATINHSSLLFMG